VTGQPPPNAVVRLRCGGCGRVLDRIRHGHSRSWLGSQARWHTFCDRCQQPAGECTCPGTAEQQLTMTYACRCGARPAVAARRLPVARAWKLRRDLYTDLPGYGLPQPLS